MTPKSVTLTVNFVLWLPQYNSSDVAVAQTPGNGWDFMETEFIHIIFHLFVL